MTIFMRLSRSLETASEFRTRRKTLLETAEHAGEKELQQGAAQPADSVVKHEVRGLGAT
jgi:hypothetical protein